MSKILESLLCGRSRAPSQFIGVGALILLLISGTAQAQFALSPDFGNNGVQSFTIDDFHYPIDILSTDDDSLLLLANVGYVDTAFDYDVALMKLGPDGEIETSFGDNGLLRFDFPGIGNSIADEMVMLDDGRFLILGSGYALDSTTYWPACLTMITNTGIIDSSFGNNGTLAFQFGGIQEYPNSLEIDSEGRILVSGSSLDTTDIHSDVPVIARMDVNGNLDTSFGEEGKAYLRFPYGVIHETREERHLIGGIIYDLLELESGKLLVCGGHSNSVNLITFVACLNANGSLDSTFFEEGYLAIDISTYDNSEAIKLIKGENDVVWFGANVQALNLRDFIIGKIDLQHQAFDIGAIDFDDKEDFMMDMVLGNNNLPLMIGYSKFVENTPNYYLSDFFAVASLSNNSFPYNSENFTYNTSSGMQSGASAGVLQSNGRLVCLGFSQTETNGANELALIGLDDLSLGVEQNAVNKLNIYPNPTSGPLHLKLDAPDSYQLKVYNEMGQLVFDKSGNGDYSFSLSLSHLPAGIYSIIVSQPNGEISSSKVVKN